MAAFEPLVFRLKEFGYGHSDAPIARAQDSVKRLEMPFARNRPCAARRRIENPDIWHTHRQIIIKPVLKFREGIVRGKNLDTDVRRAREYLLIGFRQRNHAHVGYAVAPRRDPKTLFRKGGEAQVAPAGVKPYEDIPLQFAVIFRSHFASDQLAVDEIAVGPVRG